MEYLDFVCSVLQYVNVTDAPMMVTYDNVVLKYALWQTNCDSHCSLLLWPFPDLGLIRRSSKADHDFVTSYVLY